VKRSRLALDDKLAFAAETAGLAPARATTGDIIALSPALIIEPKHIEELFGILSQALKE